MKEFRDDLAFFLRVNFAKTPQKAAVLEFSNRLISLPKRGLYNKYQQNLQMVSESQKIPQANVRTEIGEECETGGYELAPESPLPV